MAIRAPDGANKLNDHISSEEYHFIYCLLLPFQYVLDIKIVSKNFLVQF